MSYSEVASHHGVRPLFPIGRLFTTPGINAAIPQAEIAAALIRHIKGDWGLLDTEDWQTNNHALENGGRLFSAYEFQGTRFWIITEANRSVTTILLPHE